MSSFVYRARLFGALAAVFLMCVFFLSSPSFAYSVTSEELFAEAESIMQEIDVLQTSINEETERYEAALADRDQALSSAKAAQKRIEEEQERMDLFQEELALIMTDMYKSGGASSFLDVMLDSVSFEEFLTKWDSLSAYSNQGADLVRNARAAKQAQEAAKKDYEQQMDVASKKMEEAENTKKGIEEKQEALRVEAEKISEEAAELQAQEELEREAARQAAAAAEALQRAQQQQLTTGGSDYSGETIVPVSGLLQHPLPSGAYSSGFGWRDLDGGTFHKGLDLAASEGTPYYAAAAGTVVYATNDGSYNGGAGNWVVIAHGNGLVTKYMHSSAVYVKVGDVVERGQTIGAVGNTGHSYGAHLHFQVESNGVAVDPTLFI